MRLFRQREAESTNPWEEHRLEAPGRPPAGQDYEDHDYEEREWVTLRRDMEKKIRHLFLRTYRRIHDLRAADGGRDGARELEALEALCRRACLLQDELEATPERCSDWRGLRAWVIEEWCSISREEARATFREEGPARLTPRASHPISEDLAAWKLPRVVRVPRLGPKR